MIVPASLKEQERDDKEQEVKDFHQDDASVTPASEISSIGHNLPRHSHVTLERPLPMPTLRAEVVHNASPAEEVEIAEQGPLPVTPVPAVLDDDATLPRLKRVVPAEKSLGVPKLYRNTNRAFFDDALDNKAQEEIQGKQNLSFTPSLDTFANDRITTQTDLMAFHPVSPYSFSVDAIDEQNTLILPVIQISRKMEAVKPNAEEAQYTSLLTKLVKSSGIYALASFVSPLISLVLAPFLTRNLSHTDYGALAVTNTAIALMVGITQLGLNHAFFRAYSCDYETRSEKLRVVSTLVALLLLISLPITLLLIVVAPWISTFLFNTSDFSTPIRMAALVILLQNLTIPGFSWLRAENRATFFSILSIVNLLVTLATNIVLVGVLHWALTGALIATGSGYCVVVICTLPVVLLRAGFRPRMDIAWNLLSFGVPLVSSFVSVWVLQLSDRYLLSRFGSLAQTGSYAVAYTLGGIMGSVVLAPFSLAWPTAMFAIAKRDDAPAVFKLVFRWYSIGLLLATFGFSLVSMCVLFLFFPPSYASASSIIPVIAVSIMFYGIYDIFTIGIGVRRKTWYAVVLTGLSALVNIGCNILLIPIYGSFGAAASTLIAYALLAAIAYFINQRIYPIPFEVGKFIIALLVGVTCYVGAGIITQHQNLYVTMAVYIASLVMYGVFLVLLGNPFAWLKNIINKGRRNT